MIGHEINEFTHPDDHPITARARERLFAGDERILTVARVRHADGGWRRLESQTSVFTDSDGRLRAVNLVRSITDSRRTELGQDLLYWVVQQGADLVFVCEPDTTRLIFANDPATRLLGPSKSATIEGGSLLDLLSRADAERLRHEVLPNQASSEPWSGELELQTAEGMEPIPTESTIFLFSGTESTARSYLAITLRDLSKRRSAQEALRQSELRLSQAQKMEAVGRLAGGIAHDFNNLPTAIIGYSDLVLDELGAEHGASREGAEILRAAERAGGLTRQLLAISRRQILQPTSIDLNAIVADIIANIDRMMRRLIGENIELVTMLEGELRQIVADAGQIEQVIVNLVVNARDVMPDGGRITLETGNFTAPEDRRLDSGVLTRGDYTLLSVTDTGVAMDDATRTQIFEPSFTTKEPDQGTGLGLAYVYGIVSQSGGQVSVETTVDEGTTFSIYLPASRARELEPNLPIDAQRLRGTETILLVEDADPIRRLVQRTLEKIGYNVLSAESATAALRHCSRHEGPIDLMLTDVVLPEMPGPEVAQQAREIRPGFRVPFTSGFTDETRTRHGLDPAEENLLEKPFTPAAVLGRIRRLLDAPDPLPYDDEGNVPRGTFLYISVNYTNIRMYRSISI